jgi:uncharacterized membrane protein YoaK (UPF0700 family)
MWQVALLCSVAGYVDAFGYLKFGHVFAANMTGNSVLLSIAAAEGDLSRVAVYAVTLTAFLAGACVAGLLKHALQRPFVALLIAAFLLVLAQLAAADAASGLVLLSAAMGLQGAALSRFGATTLQTVVITGAMLRLADGLVGRMWARIRTTRRSAAATVDRDVEITALAWLAYALGGAAGVGGIALSDKALVVPALLLAGLGIVRALRQPAP